MTDTEIYGLYLQSGYDAILDFYEFKHRLLRGEIPEFRDLPEDENTAE